MGKYFPPVLSTNGAAWQFAQWGTAGASHQSLPPDASAYVTVLPSGAFQGSRAVAAAVFFPDPQKGGRFVACPEVVQGIGRGADDGVGEEGFEQRCVSVGNDADDIADGLVPQGPAFLAHGVPQVVVTVQRLREMVVAVRAVKPPHAVDGRALFILEAHLAEKPFPDRIEKERRLRIRVAVGIAPQVAAASRDSQVRAGKARVAVRIGDPVRVRTRLVHRLALPVRRVADLAVLRPCPPGRAWGRNGSERHGPPPSGVCSGRRSSPC